MKKAGKKARVKMWAVKAPDGTIYHNWIGPNRRILLNGYEGKYGYRPSYMKERIVRVEVREL